MRLQLATLLALLSLSLAVPAKPGFFPPGKVAIGPRDVAEITLVSQSAKGPRTTTTLLYGDGRVVTSHFDAVREIKRTQLKVAPEQIRRFLEGVRQERILDSYSDERSLPGLNSASITLVVGQRSTHRRFLVDSKQSQQLQKLLATLRPQRPQ